MDEKAKNPFEDSRWVLAFDQATDKVARLVYCPKNQVPAQKARFEFEGYRVEVLTESELRSYIDAGGE